MTGLYVICSRKPQPQLSKRRNGFQEHVVGAAFAYVREAIAPDTLGALEGQQVRILPQWIEDIGSVANDPEASFFFVEMRNRESVQHAVERGLSLPLVRRDDLLIHPDRERRSPFGK